MAYSGVLDDVRTCTKLGTPSRVPVFAISGEVDLRLSGISHDEYGRCASAMAKVNIQGIERFDYDWVFLIPDDYMEIEPLGVTTMPGDKTPRAAIKYPSLSAQTIKNLSVPDPHKVGRMPAFLDALSRIRQHFGDTICLTGNVAAPFTSVAITYDIEPTMMLLIDDHDLLRRAMDFFVDLQIQWGKAQVQAGAHAIWLGDCVATSGFISAQHYNEFAAQGAQRVAQGLKEAGALVFYHGGEIAMEHLKLMSKIGADVLSIGERTDIAPIKQELGQEICLLGNIDGIHVLQNSTLEKVEKETARIMNTCKLNGGYIFNSGEGIAYDTPEQNIKTMIRTARKHGHY